MADGKLKFKIEAEDRSKKVFDSLKERVADMTKRYKEFAKAGLDASGQPRGFQKMHNIFKDVAAGLKTGKRYIEDIGNQATKEHTKTQQKIKQTGKQAVDVAKGIARPVAGVAGYAGSVLEVGREDVALMESIGRTGKAIQEKSHAHAEQMKEKLKNAGVLKEEAAGGVGGGKKNQANALLTHVKSIDKNIKIIMRRGGGLGLPGGRTAGIGGGDTGDTAVKGVQGFLANLSNQPGIGIAGAVLSVAPMLYNINASIGKSFKDTALKQFDVLQNLNFRGGGPLGTYRYIPGVSQEKQWDTKLSWQEERGIKTSDWLQTMGTYGKQLIGRTQGINQEPYERKATELSEIARAYGIDFGAMGQIGGLLEKSKRPGENINMKEIIGRAENVNMGGAKMDEFFAELEGAISHSVSQGMNVSVMDMTKSLQNLMGGEDERLKLIAPTILQGATGIFSQAAQMKGGANEGIAFQSVYSQMREDAIKNNKPMPSFWDVREKLSEDPQSNMKAVLEQSKRLFPENEKMREMFLQQTGVFGNIASPKLFHDIISNFEQTGALEKSGAGGGFSDAGGKAIDDRIKGRQDMIKQLIAPDVGEEIALMRETSLKALTVSNDMLKGIRTLVDKLDYIASGKQPFTVLFDKNWVPPSTSSGTTGAGP